MKKLVINGGEFYKLYPLYKKSVSFSADTFVTLLDNAVAGQLYRFEFATTKRPAIYNVNTYLSTSLVGMIVVDGVTTVALRAKNDGAIMVKFSTSLSDIAVNVYEYAKYMDVSVTIPGKTTYDITVNVNNTADYVFPIIEDGKQYKVVFTTKYNGLFEPYYDGTSLTSQTLQAVVGQKFEFIITGKDGVYPSVRANYVSESSKVIYTCINPVEA